MNQVWPLDDTFADGATAYGTGVRRYLRVKPWATTLTDYDLVPAPEGGEPRLPKYQFFGYQFSGPSFGAAFMPFGASSAGNDISAFVERETYIADGEVMILPALYEQSGGLDYEAFHCVGVCGRVSGGTLTTPGGATAVDEYHSVPDGYYFMHVKKTGEDPGLVLYKVSGGTVTVLEDSPLSDFETFRPGVPDAGQPRRMRMVITGSSPTRIRCYRKIVNSGPVLVGGNFEETLVFDHSDASSPITAAGRWGAVGAAPYEYTNLSGQTTQVVTQLKSLRIRDAAGSTLHLRELWQRSLTGAPLQNVHTDEDTNTTVWSSSLDSRTLAAAYTGDMMGYDNIAGSAHRGHLLADSGNDRLVLGVDPTTVYGGTQQRYGWYFSQCPASSPQQHKKVTATFLSTATSPRETRALGVHLRGSVATLARLYGSTSESGIESRYRAGYRAYIEYQHVGGTTDTFTLKVYHHNGSTAQNYAATLLATCNLSAILALGTQFTLSVEARNFDTDAFGEGGDVALKFYVDGSAVTPVPANINGLAVEDNWLFDRRSDATSNGLLFGMYAMVETFNAAGLMTIDSFTDEVLSDPPDDQTGNDQISIALDPETDGKTGTLDMPLSWPVTEVHDFQTGDIEFDTGHRQTLPVFSKKRRMWQVQALAATLQQRQDLLDFFEAHKGTEIPFDWTYKVTGETIPVRFVTASLASKMRSAVGDGAEDFRFELVEVFDASTFNP